MADGYRSADRDRGARLILAEAGTAAVSIGVQERFTTAFAIFLGASTMQVGILSAVSHLLLAVSQLSSARLIGVLGGRKRMLVAAALMSAVPFLFLALIPVIPSDARVWALILLGSFAFALTYLGLPAWGSLVADLVPVGRRGRFLGLRSSILTGVGLTVGLSGAFLLDGLGEKVMWGFVSVFAVAVVAGVVSAVILSRVVDPNPELTIDAGDSPWKQMTNLGKTTLGRYNGLNLAFHISIGISAPFMAVYLLRELDVSYSWFVGMGVVSSLTAIAANSLWGRLVDFKGTSLVLAISATLIGLHPLLFLASGEMWYLFLIFGIIGVTSAGWGISSYNFVLENSDKEKRPAAVGTFNAVASAGMFAGALIGSAIAAHVPTLFSNQLLTLFLLSSMLRLVTVAWLMPGVMGVGGLTGIANSLLHGGAVRATVLRQRFVSFVHAILHV
ncbi:MAG: MFS transporter [Chloroflexi bacterium]|nr:MFS transporter [Chloroflexota bacterium]